MAISPDQKPIKVVAVEAPESKAKRLPTVRPGGSKDTKFGENVVTVAQAQNHLGELLRRVGEGEEFQIRRFYKIVGRIVGPVSADSPGLEDLADSVMGLTPQPALANANVIADESNIVSADGNGANPAERESSAGAVETFFDLVIDELSALRTRAEIEAIERAAKLILYCESLGGRVHVTGIGKSEHIARYVASLLSSTGTPAYFLHATECIHGSAGQVCSNDIAIAISNSGTTPELLSAIATLREFGTKVIAVSGNRDSELARISDVLLDAGVENEGGELNLVPRGSILAKIYVLCSLSVALEAQKGLTREQYARWHPGGALGRLARGE